MDLPVTNDIIDLIDSQLEEGEAVGGYDYGDPGFPNCPHCGRDWHGLPLTAQVGLMYDVGFYFEDYSAAEDDSPIVCRGSDFIGPMPDEHRVAEAIWDYLTVYTMYPLLSQSSYWGGLGVYIGPGVDATDVVDPDHLPSAGATDGTVDMDEQIPLGVFTINELIAASDQTWTPEDGDERPHFESV